MTIAETLADARRRLEAGGIEDAAIEAEVLLRHALGLSREEMLSGLRDGISGEATCRFEAMLSRRLAHEPTAYIVGRREFFGIDFEVTRATLIPRPETELLVEAAVALGKARSRIRRGPVFADIGTGCGAIAVALAMNVARSDVHAVDVSPEALEVARRNAQRHGVADRVYFHRGHLLTPLPEYVDVVVANLPYVTSGEWQRLPPEIRDHEPRSALDGGPDGLDLVRELLREAPRYLRPRGCVVIEFGAGQAEAVREAARQSFPGYRLETLPDLAGLDRALIIAPQD
ncbi:MAG TPA: peptide chain release factor N(5)-glutamine methyltransferase [Dehalococcoidia bacterium]|nr:peptide chain release factor N(5)-glutamine methyltransferase [Dehalococcoidia bacterium]